MRSPGISAAGSGEQAEVYITTVRLPQALLVPEAAIKELGKKRDTIWTVKDGYLQRSEVTLGHRLLDRRYKITGGMPDNATALIQLRTRLRVGRAARITQQTTTKTAGDQGS